MPKHETVLAVLGWPVGHSVSPAMHNAGFAALGLPYRYHAFPVPGGQLAGALAGVRSLGFAGVNLTIPHKEAALPLLDEVDSFAAAVGAVNTVVQRDGRLLGYNTDGPGFVAALAQGGITAAGRRVVILGAGGAARAITAALSQAGAASVTVLARRPEQAVAVARLTRLGTAAGQGLPWFAETPDSSGRPPLSPHAAAALGNADMVVNCTPAGLTPNVDETPLPHLDLLPAHAAVVDTLFNPRPTRLLREAAARGLTVQDGLGMLVQQGALAWVHWFGQPGPVDILYAAALAALEENR
jgi:shikimate dehydrogenase